MLMYQENLQALFAKFKDSMKVGVGVSFFTKGHFNHFDPFDVVFGREGAAEEARRRTACRRWPRNPRYAARRLRRVTDSESSSLINAWYGMSRAEANALISLRSVEGRRIEMTCVGATRGSSRPRSAKLSDFAASIIPDVSLAS